MVAWFVQNKIFSKMVSRRYSLYTRHKASEGGGIYPSPTPWFQKFDLVYNLLRLEFIMKHNKQNHVWKSGISDTSFIYIFVSWFHSLSIHIHSFSSSIHFPFKYIHFLVPFTLHSPAFSPIANSLSIYIYSFPSSIHFPFIYILSLFHSLYIHLHSFLSSIHFTFTCIQSLVLFTFHSYIHSLVLFTFHLYTFFSLFHSLSIHLHSFSSSIHFPFTCIHSLVQFTFHSYTFIP